MKSADTNLLLWALDGSSRLSGGARKIWEEMAANPGAWVLADQVLFETYRALRNPAVTASPFSSEQAARLVRELRDLFPIPCGYRPELFSRTLSLTTRFPARKGLLIFDAVLAVTLADAGVTTFYTRNARDFAAFGLFEVIDPWSAPL